MCRSLDSLLTKAGYLVETAGDGKEALELYRRNPHDLVITDIKMPKMDGIELMQEVRRDNPDSMVILMTAYASLDTAVAAINTGAYDYIVKPVEFTQLRLAVKRALEKRELQESRAQLMQELQDKNIQLSRRVAEIDALYQAGLTLSRAADLNTLLTRIIELALDVIKASVGSVMLLNPETNELTISAAVGLGEEVRKRTRVKLGSRIAGHVAKTGEPLLISDIDNDPRFSRYQTGGYETGSALCVPLKVKDRILGVINLSDPREDEEFTEADLNLLETFASQAAIAISSGEHFEQLRRKLEELSVLYKIASELANVDNSSDMTQLIYGSLKKIIDVDFTAWLSWSDRGEKLVFNSWEGFGEEEAARLIGREVPLKDKTIYSTNLRTAAIKEEIERLTFFKDQVKTLTAVPIITKGALHGVFCLGSRRENAISADDEYIASIVTSQATSIYERQRAILNATRLVAMGKMISEISHDLKKPLTNIRGSLQIMRQHWPEIAEKDDFFSTAEQELLRLNELVLELVDFSNPRKYQLERKQISELIKRILRLVENDLNKHQIEFATQFQENLPAVMINENEIVELLLNLIHNAIDSMPTGGKLTIVGVVQPKAESGKSMVELQISDSGDGIAPELQDKVFDRYFTTKESGTGLGLAICERIVMAHNGSIELDSRIGEGTTIRIRLPAV